MSERITAVLNQIEAEQEAPAPDGRTALELLQAVYRERRNPLTMRMRATRHPLRVAQALRHRPFHRRRFHRRAPRARPRAHPAAHDRTKSPKGRRPMTEDERATASSDLSSPSVQEDRSTAQQGHALKAAGVEGLSGHRLGLEQSGSRSPVSCQAKPQRSQSSELRLVGPLPLMSGGLTTFDPTKGRFVS
jgi:hypothetical protein